MSPATTSSTRNSCPPARTAAWSCLPAGRSCSAWRARTRHPRLLRAPVPVQAGCGPGRVNTFEFVVDEDQAGQTFRGQCAELCGSGHPVMLFDVHAKTPADFDAWLAAKIEAANASPTPAPSRPPPPRASPRPPAGDGRRSPSARSTSPSRAGRADRSGRHTVQDRLREQDPNIPHNVEIKDAGGASVCKGDIFNGVATQTYDVPALAAVPTPSTARSTRTRPAPTN